MVWDVYREDGIADGRRVWKHQEMIADDLEQMIDRIRGLGVLGEFRVYPQSERCAFRAHVVQVFEVERWR